VIGIGPIAVGDLAARHGGEARSAAIVSTLAQPKEASEGALAPLLSLRYLQDAQNAHARGAVLLVAKKIVDDPRVRPIAGWVHEHASWALAEMLERANVHDDRAHVLENTIVADGTILFPRVHIGRGVRIGANCAIGAPGFGWAMKNGAVKNMPQKGGVVIEDDVWIGALTTIDAGTLSPTIIGRGAKIDAQVHIGHNCEVGEGTLIAAQTGLAGSVRVGKGVLIGGQVGIADHVTIGDGARIAAKSGVIGDVPAGAVVAGYPALLRMRWLRGLAKLFR